MLDRRLAWQVTFVAMMTMTVSYIDRQTLAVLAPSVTKALEISDTEYGFLTSAFSLVYLVATPLAGWWLDRTGARRGLFASVLVWSAIAAMQAVVPSFAVLLVVRLALGLAEGPSFPGAAQTMMRVLPERDRSRGFGLLFMGSSIGSMVTPPLVSLLYRAAGWRVAFLGTAAIGLLWVPLWLAMTSRPDVAERLDAAEVAEPGVARPSFFALVRHPLMIRALIAILAVAPAIGFVYSWSAKYLVRTFAVDQGDVGGYLWLPPLLLDVGAFGFGDLAARLARKAGAPPRMLVAVASVLAANLALLSFAETPWQAMAIAATAMAGGGGIYTLVTADLLVRMPPASVAFASGILAGAQSLALVISGPLVGWAVDRTSDYVAISIGLGLWVFPGILVWLAWRPAAHFSTKT